MRINIFKFIILIALSVFIAASFFAPFIRVQGSSAELIMSFSELISGKSADIMSGSKYGMLAAMPAASMLVVLFLPNYTDHHWSSRVVSLVSLSAALVFLAAFIWPLMQGVLLIFASPYAEQAGIYPMWGTYFVVYWGLFCLVFMFLISLHSVRMSVLSMN